MEKIRPSSELLLSPVVALPYQAMNASDLQQSDDKRSLSFTTDIDRISNEDISEKDSSPYMEKTSSLKSEDTKVAVKNSDAAAVTKKFNGMEYQGVVEAKVRNIK